MTHIVQIIIHFKNYVMKFEKKISKFISIVNERLMCSCRVHLQHFQISDTYRTNNELQFTNFFFLFLSQLNGKS